ncbi:hypothetical protein [Helicobacter suis]|uniref:hypothetical protein n=1 Tax=Helicobacter suis TaxID=104628 RepID=UPI0013CFB771|nr:hypothetical protein [Helicobacter suis]
MAVFKLDRAFVEFSTTLAGKEHRFRYYALNDYQNKQLASLSLQVQNQSALDSFLQTQSEIIADNLECISETENAQTIKDQFLETLKENGKSADFLNFVQEELEALKKTKKPSLKP